MKQNVIVSVIMVFVGISMIFIALSLITDEALNYEELDIRNMAASANMYVKDSIENSHEKREIKVKEVNMEIAPGSFKKAPNIKVYDGLTLDELAAKIDRNLGDGYIAGKGALIAGYCIDKGVDPYLATAIMLHETGCRAKCSNLVTQCNNVGGQKGSPKCGSGAFKKFDSLDEGIYGFINNLYKNYYAMGLNTVETIAPKYCEGNSWAGMINWYIKVIKNS